MNHQEHEKWVIIGDYPDYQVSNLGRVKSIKFGKERILGGSTDKDGYKILLCRKNGKYKGYKIHRLVALYFINNPRNKPQVNHLDSDKTNNNVLNLEWCTNDENVHHAVSMGLVKNSNRNYDGKVKLSLEKAREIRKIRSVEKLSLPKIALIYGVSERTIRRIIGNRTWKECTAY